MKLEGTTCEGLLALRGAELVRLYAEARIGFFCRCLSSPQLLNA